MSAYKSISDWDDAAAFEAFQNAKARYRADINGMPCDIPLPDPDMFIEMVNHKVVIDPKLVEDLEKHPPPRLPDGEKDGSSGRDSFIFESKPIPAAGWGNAGDGSTEDHHSVNWDKFIEQPHRSPGWGDSENHISRNGDSSDAWNCRGGWGDVTVQDCSGGGDGTNYSWNKGRDPSWGQHWNNEQGRGNNRKRSRGHYDSRFSKSKQMNNHQAERSKWNDRAERNKADYSYEKTMRGGQLMFMQQSEPRWSYWPANHQRSGESGGARCWEKSVS